MKLDVLALLPCNCWLAFMHLRKTSKGTHHGRERCRTQSDPEYNVNTVLLAQREDRQSTGPTSRYEDHHRARDDTEMREIQTGE